MQRGEVWWANIALPGGRRPVVLVTRDAAYELRTSVTVVPITRTIRRIPTEVPLGVEDGMPEKCIANADDVMTITKSTLTSRITILSIEKMQEVAKAVIFALDLEI